MEAKAELVKVVLQDGIKDCGICCLLSIIRFYGGEVAKEYLREITNTTKEGVSLYYLQDAAIKLGMDAFGVTGNLENINVNNLPCIAHIRVKKSYQHFVVIYQIDKASQEVVLMDPAKGKRVLSFSEFRLLSTNYYLFLKPKRVLPKFYKKKIIYERIRHLLQKQKMKTLLLFFLTLNYFAFSILTAYTFRYLMDYSISYHTSQNLFPLCFSLGMLFLIQNITFYLKEVLLDKWNCLFSYDIMTYVYQKMLLLPYLYYKNRTTGEVISRFQDLGVVQEYLIQFFCAISDLFFCIFLFFLLFQYNFLLTMVIQGFFLIEFLYVFIFQRRKKKYLRKLKSSKDVVESYLIQGISNVDTIKGSHLEKRFTDKFLLCYQHYQEHSYSAFQIFRKENLLKGITTNLNSLFLYGIGSFLVIVEKISVGGLIVFQNFMNYYLTSLGNVVNLISNYPSYKISLDRLEELFLLELENFQNHYFYLTYQLQGKIEFHNLSFRVGPKELFHNLDLEILKGEKILLCGESGCGKSTLMKMLLRYVSVPFGSIKIAGIDINHYHLQNIRSNITYVTSNEFLFSDTLRNNIMLYQEYSEEDFLNVCHLCFVDEIIEKKDSSFDWMIEENGFNLSSGERQRIILARSILKRSNIYIFDEALGQVDIMKEKKLLENIFAFLKDKTIIVISHRFNNKKLFDRVCRLEDGVIHEIKKL